jgi:hypothetical protein
MAGLKRVVIGTVGGDINKRLIKALTDEYDLTRAGVTFKTLALADVHRALEAKEVRAILIVMPLTEKYLALLRSLFPQSAKSNPVLIPIDSAAPLPRGRRSLRSFACRRVRWCGSPPVPADDVTALRTSFSSGCLKKTDAIITISRNR